MKIDQILGHTEWYRHVGIPAERNGIMQFDGRVAAKHEVSRNDKPDIFLRGTYYFGGYVVREQWDTDYNPSKQTNWEWICVTSIVDTNNYPLCETRYFIRRDEWDGKRGRRNEPLRVSYRGKTPHG